MPLEYAHHYNGRRITQVLAAGLTAYAVHLLYSAGLTYSTQCALLLAMIARGKGERGRTRRADAAFL